MQSTHHLMPETPPCSRINSLAFSLYDLLDDIEKGKDISCQEWDFLNRGAEIVFAQIKYGGGDFSIEDRLLSEIEWDPTKAYFFFTYGKKALDRVFDCKELTSNQCLPIKSLDGLRKEFENYGKIINEIQKNHSIPDDPDKFKTYQCAKKFFKELYELCN